MTAAAAERAWQAFLKDLDEEASAWVEATYEVMKGAPKSEKFNPYHDALGRFATAGGAIFHSGLRPGSGSRVLPPEPEKPKPKPKPVVERKKPEQETKKPTVPGAETGRPATGAEARSRMDAIVNDKESRRLKAEVKKYDDQINKKYREANDLGSAADEAAIRGNTALFTRLADQKTAVYAEISALQKERTAATNASIKYDKDAGQRVKEQLLYHDQPAKLGPPNMTPALKTAKGVNEGHAEFAKLVGPGHVDGRSAYFRALPAGSREYFDQDSFNIHVSKNTTRHTTVHEMGHWLEDNNQLLHQEAINFRNRRTAGESAVRMNDIKGHSGYDKTEMTKPDKFLHPYIGKSYPGNSATEVISMGLEYMSKDPVGMAKKDPDYFDFIFDVVRRTAAPGSRKASGFADIGLPGSWLIIEPKAEKYNPYHDARGRFAAASAATFHSGLRPGPGSVVLPPEAPKKPEPAPPPPSTRRYATGAEARKAMDELLAGTPEQKRLEAEYQVAKKAHQDSLAEVEKRKATVDRLTMHASTDAEWEAVYKAKAEHEAAWQEHRKHADASNRAYNAMAEERNYNARQAREVVFHSEPAKFKVTVDTMMSPVQRATNEEGIDIFRRLVGPGILDNKRIAVNTVPPGDPLGQRSYFRSSRYGVKGGVFMGSRATKDVTVHELGHWLEDQSTGIQFDRRKFMDRRTGKSYVTKKLSDLTGDHGYDESEVSRPDKFKHPYTGKVYPGGNASEVISMGLQEMAKDPIQFAKDDPDFFDFIYDTIGKHVPRKAGR